MTQAVSVYRAISILAVLCVVHVVWRWLRNRCRLPQPPGPRPLPILGNIFDWPTKSPWLTFTEWKSKYGDIVHIELAGINVIVLNSASTAQQMMGRAIYSDRPRLVMAGETMGYVRSMALARWDGHWKSLRRLAQHGFSKTASMRYQPSHMHNIKVLLEALLKEPKDYIESLRYVIGKNILEATYGIEVDSNQHKYIKASEDIQRDISNAIVPGNFLVDIFPSLKHLPGFNLKKYADRAKRLTQEMVYDSFDEVKRTMATGTCNSCYVSGLLEDEKIRSRTNDFEYAVKWAAGTLYGAGAETTLACLSTFFLAMATNPDVQKKAQEQVDRVLGRDRLPTFADREQLPYIDAIVKESLRWQPPVCLGIPHRVVEEDVYDGYRIPKGSLIIPNVWAMSKDSETYKDPLAFQPERFMRTDGENDLDPSAYVFGFGRRACPGNHFATDVLFIAIASILTAFNIKAQDEQGNDVSVEPKFTDAFVSHAVPFPCRITPRSQIAVDLIRSM